MPKNRSVLALPLLLILGLSVWSCTGRSQSTTATTRQLASVPLQPLSSGWLRRVRATADNPRLARQVIVDSIYANRTLEVALAYGKMYDQKPSSQFRLANFAHAITVAEVFCPQRGEELTVPYSRAIQALKAIVVPEQDLLPSEQAQAVLKKTKVADAWLAWGIFSIRYTMDHKSAGDIYKYALSLDPTFHEANYWMADRIIAPYNETYFKAHKDEAVQDLNIAEQFESKLYPLVVDCRANIALGNFDYKAAIPYLREYLRVWPSSPRAFVVARTLKQVEGLEQPRQTTNPVTPAAK